ncbi:NUDIX domain-containing protein [Kribbella deserti]|uniref:8-oxo-dGTP diphosphatase n=1 Tax=Kribbella deserti TaxID=1926257 RepID=A0ABV6QFY8_9ACTN
MHKVVIGALVTGRRVLLAHRSPNKLAYPGVWDLPGGVVETGESELEALARELNEELGVKIATSSVSQLGRVEAGPAEDPAHVSAAASRPADERGLTPWNASVLPKFKNGYLAVGKQSGYRRE